MLEKILICYVFQTVTERGGVNHFMIANIILC